MTASSSPIDTEAVQASVQRARARLLGGRGPGADTSEVDRHTRARPRLDGETTSQHLEVLARATAIARGDAAAIAVDIAATIDRLALTLEAIGDKASPRRVLSRHRSATKIALKTASRGVVSWPSAVDGRVRAAMSGQRPPVEPARENPVGPRTAAALEVVRGGYGALQLALPGLVADRLLAHPLDQPGRAVARALGARQLAQALASGTKPTYPVLTVGVGVDALHMVSMLGLALVDRRHRHAALTDALVASSFALGGLLAARVAPRPHPGQPSSSRRCDRWADRLARALVPGYPPTTSRDSGALTGRL